MKLIARNNNLGSRLIMHLQSIIKMIQSIRSENKSHFNFVFLFLEPISNKTKVGVLISRGIWNEFLSPQISMIKDYSEITSPWSSRHFQGIFLLGITFMQLKVSPSQQGTGYSIAFLFVFLPFLVVINYCLHSKMITYKDSCGNYLRWWSSLKSANNKV